MKGQSSPPIPSLPFIITQLYVYMKSMPLETQHLPPVVTEMAYLFPILHWEKTHIYYHQILTVEQILLQVLLIELTLVTLYNIKYY